MTRPRDCRLSLRADRGKARERRTVQDIAALVPSRAHSPDLPCAVCDAQTGLYVNEHSLDIGDDGLRAVSRLAGSSFTRGNGGFARCQRRALHRICL